MPGMTLEADFELKSGKFRKKSQTAKTFGIIFAVC